VRQKRRDSPVSRAPPGRAVQHCFELERATRGRTAPGENRAEWRRKPVVAFSTCQRSGAASVGGTARLENAATRPPPSRLRGQRNDLPEGAPKRGDTRHVRIAQEKGTRACMSQGRRATGHRKVGQTVAGERPAGAPTRRGRRNHQHPCGRAARGAPKAAAVRSSRGRMWRSGHRAGLGTATDCRHV